MLKKLDNRQVSENWHELKQAVQKAFPRQPKDVDLWMNRLLTMILSNEGAVWVGLDEEGKIIFVLVTLFIIDPCSMEKHLFIYSLFGYRVIPQSLWEEGPKALEAYARDTGCSAVVGYSEVPRVVEMAGKLGADVKTTYIQWRL